jgi:nicotinamide mononucleotide transporter
VIWQWLRAATLADPRESIAVVLGLIYVALVYKRNRLGWIAGGISSAIYVYLAAGARLPMQSTLQAYYVVMAVYGWISWTAVQQQSTDSGISTWPLRNHLLAAIAICVASLVSARWLALETHAAWPYLDSLTTWISLLATWMTARMKLENWLYWIVADAITAYLFAAQGYLISTGLFVAYLVIAIFGYAAWREKYRQVKS